MHFDIFKQIPITQIIRNRKHSMPSSALRFVIFRQIPITIYKYKIYKYTVKAIFYWEPITKYKYKVYKYTVKAIFYWEPRWMAACLCSPPLWVGHRWWRACQALWGEILFLATFFQIFNFNRLIADKYSFYIDCSVEPPFWILASFSPLRTVWKD